MAAETIDERITQLPGQIVEANERIRPLVWRTPLMYSRYLSDWGKAEVYLKLENEQLTGSFKLRGATNKLMMLKERNPSLLLEKEVFTASSGNHALGCLEASKKVAGCNVNIFCRENVDATKVEALNAYGAKVTRYGQDCVDAEKEARRQAEARGHVFISPYNDWDVVAGQGTVGYEIYDQLPSVDCVLVSVGGGGAIAGIASYIKSVNSKIQIIGCQPCNSRDMYECIRTGVFVQAEQLDTLSDCTTGHVEEGSITIPLCGRYVDDWILVEEDQIAKAIFTVLDKHHKVIEGSAGVAVAAYMYNKQRFRGQNVVILICGGNISTATLKNIIENNS